MLTKEQKQKIIKKFQINSDDTGSLQVQIAILCAEVKELQEHLKEHKKDHSARRGLIRKVNQRRKLLNYLMKEDEKAYEDLIKKLKLKRRMNQLSDIRAKLAEEEFMMERVEDNEPEEDKKD